MSKVPANWDYVKRVVEIRNEMKKDTLIFGNGDVIDIPDAIKKAKETKCDGIMFGRAIFGSPWLFSKKVPTTSEKIKIMLEHTKLFEKLLGDIKSFSIMKKHYKAYINGFDGARELRTKLMKTNSFKEVKEAIDIFDDLS